MYVDSAFHTSCFPSEGSLESIHIIIFHKILGFHGCDYEEWCLLGCYTVWLL
jgi:hypothetical protein